MSGVPKSRREEHDFMASHKLYDIRRRITELAINDFGYDQEKMERKIQKFENSLVGLDENRKREVVARMRIKNEGYYAAFVEEETRETRSILRKVVFEYELGNSIFPTGEAKLEEYKERRLHLDNAIGWLCCLKQELQYIAETLPGDINRYAAVIIDGIKGQAKQLGIFINEKKTRIVKLSGRFKYLQIKYSLSDTGRVIRRINPVSVTRERRKLKAYKRLMDRGVIPYEDIEQAYKSWMGAFAKLMSKKQRKHMKQLFRELYGKEPKWKT